jgi:hypothetical protein
MKPVVHCYRCEWRGTHFALIKAITGVESNIEVWSLLAGERWLLTGYSQDLETIADVLDQEAVNAIAPDADVLETMPPWYSPFSDVDKLERRALPVIQYTLGRLPVRDIIRYGVGWCTDPRNINAMRMIIPIERGYFQARTIYKGGRTKYANPDNPIGDRLFNGKALLKGGEVYITEGAISGMALGTNSVATLGKGGANMYQRNRLADAPVDTYIIAYDAGEATSLRVSELGDFLEGHGHAVDIRDYMEGDPDSCGVYDEYEYDFGRKVEDLLNGHLHSSLL